MGWMAPVPHLFARLHRLAVLIAIVVFAALAAVALATGPADAARVTVLGAAAPAKPSCPDAADRCVVEARVTGFQTKIGNIKKPFVAPFPGRVVAWSVKLGRPDGNSEECFSEGCEVGDETFEGFGGPARARLAILRPVTKEIKAGHPIYELVEQSPIEELKPFFGTTITFTLEHPLKMKKGHIAALTIPTWAPVFAGIGGSTWRASRQPTTKRGGCIKGGGANINAGSPHQKVGKRRRYGCTYQSRLLYSASLVRRPGS
jgi:hypothetical protein